MPETLVLLNNLKYLVYNLKSYLKLDGVEILCRLVECSITVIILQKSGSYLQDEFEQDHSEEKPPVYFQLTDIPDKVLSLYKDLYGHVTAFVETKLPVRSLEYCNNHEWDKELQVSISAEPFSGNMRVSY